MPKLFTFDADAYADRAAEALHRFRSTDEIARHKLTAVEMPPGALLLTIPEWPKTEGDFEIEARELLDVIYVNMRNSNATCVIALSFTDPPTISKSCSLTSPCAGRLICGPTAGVSTVLLPSPIHGIIIPPNFTTCALVTTSATAPALANVLALMSDTPQHSRPN